MEDKRVTKARAWELWSSGVTNKTEIARQIIKEFGLEVSIDLIRNRISRQINTRERNSALFENCERMGVDPKDVKRFWLKDLEHNVSLEVNAATNFDKEAFIEELTESVKAISPRIPKIRRRGNKQDGHLLIIDVADLHIGKYSVGLGDDYNADIACKRATEGLQGLLDKTAGFRIDKIIFVAGNDVLHHAGNGKTTKGTELEFDLQWDQAFIRASNLYIRLLNRLMAIAPVQYIHCMSNHDYHNGWMLSKMVETYYRKCKNITFDNSVKHRKYAFYGTSLMMLTHGDKCKWSALPGQMAVEGKEHWAKADHRYVYVHHVHHLSHMIAKDYPGVTVESLRSPAGTDFYHHNAGFLNSPKAVTGFIHSKKDGQIARISHLF